MALKLAVIFIVFCFVVVFAVPTLKVTNGINANTGQYPFAVSFRFRNCHNCGGSIIGENWVLTAAHCVYPRSMYLADIMYGTIDSNNCKVVPNNTVKIKRYVVHEDYSTVDGHNNDIALLEMEKPFKFSDEVQPVGLPEQDSHPEETDDARLVGWGYTKDKGVVMPILQQVSLVIFPDDFCELYHSSNYSTCSHICAGVYGNGKGQCTGDSGGPLTVNGTQYGIVSWSDKPCASSPGVLTRVSSFRDWIHKITGI